MSPVIKLFIIFGFGLGIVIIRLLVEHRTHSRRLDQIPLRVMVNGIRGKSSITRLTAGALRADPRMTVFAKTTGTAARFIYPGGREVPVARPYGVINVIEQVAAVRRAVGCRVTALVAECMAVQPQLQEFNTTHLVRPGIVVISNVREDHLDEMGPTLADVARSLARSMPHGGVCITAEANPEILEVLRHEARVRSCQLVTVDPATVTENEMAGFNWVTFPENVAIALEVARRAGVERTDALYGMWRAAPDPGVLRVTHHQHGGKTFSAGNLFAANDPESTTMNVDMLRDRGMLTGPLAVVINCRPDRITRNGQMGGLVEQLGADTIHLIGHPTRSAMRAIPEHLHDRVVDLGGHNRTGGEILDAITADLPGDGAALVMIGNIHGHGELLLDALADATADTADTAHTARSIMNDDTVILPAIGIPV